MKKIWVFIFNFIFIFSVVTSVSATSIIYDASDLGGGTWQYSYLVSDFTFNTDYGFTVYFDYGLYENIIPISDSGDWDEISWEPDPLLGAGAYDALALTDGASLIDPFTVSFHWLGIGTPWEHAQDFEIYYLDPFQIIETGTTSPIPEPGTLILLITVSLGLTGFGIRKFKI